jgi:hypothetical protein
LADENPPVGGNAKDFEAAAKAQLAKAKDTRAKVKGATKTVKDAGAELDAAEHDLAALDRELEQLLAQRRKVEKRLASADRRLFVSDTSTPANQDRIQATYDRHKAELERIENRLGQVQSAQHQAQAAREAPTVMDRISMTPSQRAAKARRLEREAKIAAARAQIADENPVQGNAADFERVARRASTPIGWPRRLTRRAAAAARGAHGAEGRQVAPTPPHRRAACAALESSKRPRTAGPLYQRLRDLMATRVAGEEATARAAQEQAAEAARQLKVSREVARRKERAEINAAAKAQLASEAVAARVGPEHEATQEAVRQARLERRLTRARERQVATVEAEVVAEVAHVPGTDLIRHPTEFGRRVPGPFGQVTVPAEIGYPSTTPLKRTAEQGPRDIYAGNPRRGRSSIGESPGEILVLRNEAAERSKAAKAAKAAEDVQNAAAQRHAENVARSEAAEASYADRLAESSQGMRRWSAQLGVVDQAMRRHGTFTTEFISAAAKGEVAYREWGWQIGAAATKFGAWTAAGAGIYAALGAVTAVGQGAIQSASGVEALKRSVNDVQSGPAQQSFRDQAAHFNVPIDQVADAQQRMGQVFHNQADAAKAATAALYALQTGQVDVAQSTKDLTAISQAYGASATDLVNLFDELNFVQNNYNARIPDMETGIASAAGSFKQLGGSLEDMVTLFTVLQRHGQTGNVAATIFRRVPNELAKPSNQAVLRANQIDPTAPIMQVIKQAQAAIGRGGDARAIAAAIAGPQFAGRIIGLLTDPKTTSEIGGRLARGEAAGASERELQHVKDEAVNVLKAIGIQLGNLGSNLAQSGFATVFGVMAKSLVLTLSIVNSLLSVFNQWPQLFKDVAASVVVAMAALAGARRLGIGGALEKGRFKGAAPYLIETDERRTRRLVGKGLGDAVSQTQDEQERLTAASFRAAAERDRAVRAEGDIVKDTNRRLAEGTIDEVTAAERKAAAEIASTAAAERARDASYKATAAIEQAAQQHMLQAEFDTLMATTARRDRNAVAQQWAVQQGMFIRPSLGADVPAAEHVRQMMAAGGGYQGPAGASPTTGAYPVPFGPVRQGAQYAVPIGPLTKAQADAASAAAGTGTGQARRVLPQARRAMSKLGAEMAAAKAESGRLAAASVATSAAIRGAGIGLTAAAGAMRGLFASMYALIGGPIGLALAALAFAPAIYDSVKSANKRLNDLKKPASELPELPDSKSAADAAIKELEKERKNRPDFGTSALEIFDPRNFRNLNPGKQRQDAIKAREEAIRKQAAQVEQARKAGKPAAGLSGNQILAQSQRDVEDFQRGRIDLNELNRRQQTRLQEILIAGANHKGATPGRAKQLQEAIDDLFKQADATIQEGIDARYNLLKSQTDDPVEQANLGVKEATEKLQAAQETAKNSKDQASADAVINAQADVNNAKRAVQDAIKAQAQAQLDAAGALVNQGGVSTAGVSSYITKLETEIDKLNGSTKPEDIQRLVALRAQLVDVLTNVGKADLDTALAIARSQTAVDRAYRKSDKQFESAARTANKNGNPRLARQIRAARTQRALEELQGRSDYMDAKSAVDQGAGQAGLPRLQAQLAEIGKKVQLALKLHLRGTKAFMQLITEQQQAEAAIVTQQASLIDAQAEYVAAGEGSNQVAAAADRIAGLEQKLALARKHPEVEGLGDRVSVLGILTQLREARTQQADTIRQQATDLIEAQYALKESLNDDPVYQANLEAQKAAAILRAGGFSSPADRLKAQADANNAKRAAQDAAVEAQIENIDYDVEIGKMTVEQQIAAYERLLKTAKMGQSEKKKITQEIGRLKHQAETGSESFSLDVGNIRLPSVYEVHRAIREGHDARSRMTVNNSPTVNVNLAPGDDGSAVVRSLDRYLGTSARSAMRASADIGV